MATCAANTASEVLEDVRWFRAGTKCLKDAPFFDARRGNWQRQDIAIQVVQDTANLVVCQKPACFTYCHLRLQ